MAIENTNRDKDLPHHDPVTGAPDFHPVGTGIGAAAGGMAAGAAVGTVAGPVGTALGAAVGAVAGGLMGKAVAERIDPDVEDSYWRDNYSAEPYVPTGATYDDYGPAYRYGVDRYNTYEGRSFDEVESDLGRNWDASRGRSSLDWDRAKYATQASWHRVKNQLERAIPGDSDHDGH